ncbi:hypothetical protein SISSUDRAFT_1043854 [Sistotremastrum suecicum HHB10207 ss-3]|uniref:Uncharacterized protein n=1 Tax=Sistotremastrum suecicum HHB10207 ss-3 TaxID=1314776 RepID=A0A166FJI3_9AGAM|nr:hypothetical protein SISSUDRAFT_1043854 [Sistotremastrum suecicum HHB10207 ss-3]
MPSFVALEVLWSSYGAVSETPTPKKAIGLLRPIIRTVWGGFALSRNYDFRGRFPDGSADVAQCKSRRLAVSRPTGLPIS